jgi:hypothetical protein
VLVGGVSGESGEGRPNVYVLHDATSITSEWEEWPPLSIPRLQPFVGVVGSPSSTRRINTLNEQKDISEAVEGEATKKVVGRQRLIVAGGTSCIKSMEVMDMNDIQSGWQQLAPLPVFTFSAQFGVLDGNTSFLIISSLSNCCFRWC